MDRGVSMEGPPRITVDGYGPIPVPQTIEEWLDPKIYPGQNINWYMSRTQLLHECVPVDMINAFYYSDEHRSKFEELFNSLSGSEYLNFVINSCHRITDDYHQQWLMTVASRRNHAAEFMIEDLEERTDPASQRLKKCRNTIWQLIK